MYCGRQILSPFVMALFCYLKPTNDSWTQIHTECSFVILTSLNHEIKADKKCISMCECPLPQILTDEDDTAYPHLNSTSSSGSAENNDPTPPPPDPKKQRKTEKQKLPPQPTRFPVPLHMGSMYDHLPIVYAPHTALIGPGNPVHQYKCKYPGCNQV